MKKSYKFSPARLCTLVIGGSLMSLPALAQVTAPKYANEFLNLGVGGRGIGMGNAQVALAQDVTAGYWNPAGLTAVSTPQLSLMHAEYFMGMANYNYGGFATALDKRSTIGVSLVRFSVDDIPDTRDLYRNGQLDYSRIRRFSAADNALFLSFARQSEKVKGLSLGGNMKVIYRNAGSFATAWGFGVDLAARYTRNNWYLGAVLRDLGTFTAWTYNVGQLATAFAQTGNTIPQSSVELTTPRLSLGVARLVQIAPSHGLDMKLALDADITTDGKRNVLLATNVVSVDPRVGMELGYKQMVFLRLGAGQIQQVKNLNGEGRQTVFQPNFGLGARLNRFAIDYALTDLGNQAAALYSNIFSIRIDLGKAAPLSERKVVDAAQ